MIRLASLISRIVRHKDKAKELKEQNISDYFVFNTLAMECFQAVNSAIELGELVVSEKNLGFPSRYREIFELLYNAKMISKKTLESFKRLVFLKNLIAHEYYMITDEELAEMATLLGCLDELIANAKKELNMGSMGS
ncbi:hypothetical protein C5S39_14250 [Candidatus Methanophagaceae archaeon]|nr:hypothetical protein C5S39_14250 [Methanophagales archaeon]